MDSAKRFEVVITGVYPNTPITYAVVENHSLWSVTGLTFEQATAIAHLVNGLDAVINELRDQLEAYETELLP